MAQRSDSTTVKAFNTTYKILWKDAADQPVSN